MQRASTVSNRVRWRKRSLSRKRPCRFFENVEWSGTRASRPSRPEPAVREVQMDFLAQPSLRPNAKAVANDQHADHQLGINRRPPGLAVEWRQLPSQLTQSTKRSIDRTT